MVQSPASPKVFISHRASRCADCEQDLGTQAWIQLTSQVARCLTCADLDHLVFLAPGDAALTRRATRSSALSAIVLKWSKARKRYERQGILVEPAALADRETKYDALLMSGVEFGDARKAIQADVDEVLERWRDRASDRP